MKKIFLLTIVIFAFNASTTFATNIPAGLVSGQWTLAGSPYNILGNIQIPNDSTLSIEPGVSVIFQGAYKLNVQGRLLAIGSICDTIAFTAFNTTVGWKGIRFDNTPATNDTSKIIYCKIQYGKATGSTPNYNGGAIYFNSFSKGIISRCRISNCTANAAGGGVYCIDSSPSINNNIISDNTASTGGGVYCSNSNPVVSYNTISFNTATGANGVGGIYCDNGSATINNNNITYNISSYYGGGIYCGGGGNGIVITHNNISNNTANTGGGIYCNGSSPIISYNTISNNLAYYGSGLYCYNGSNPAITNNIISNNKSTTGISEAGGIYCYNSSPTISSNTISNNMTNGHGGGISCFYGSNSTISNNKISNNTAINGGGIYCNSSSPIISNNTISNNSSSSNGGGIYCESSTPTILNSTITNNSSENGGALFCDLASNPTFRNCILWGNTANTNGAQLFLNDEASNPNFFYCDVQDGSDAFEHNGNIFSGTYQNNLDSNPLFVAPSGGSGTGFNGVIADWSLQNSSPCIDAGDPNGVYPINDIADNPRVNVCRIDIGAFEYQLGIPFIVTLRITQPIICNGLATGGVTAVVSGGTLPYTYLWSNGDTTVTITGLVANNYTVTVSTTSYGCVITKGILLSQPPATSVNAGTDTTIICGGSAQLNAKPKWVTLNSSKIIPLNSVFFIDVNTGYVVVDDGTILKTSDGGTNWIAQTSGTTNSLSSVYFPSANTGYIVGYNGVILKTTNGGINWVTQNSITSNLNSVYFTDVNTGYVVGYGGRIYKTTDGGITWFQQTSTTTNTLYSVYFTDASSGYAVSEGGTILKTINGGNTWTHQTYITSTFLRSIYFINADTGYIVGTPNYLLKTVNAGLNWTVQTIGAPGSLLSIYFTDPSTGYIAGDQTILKTTDGGATWIQQFNINGSLNSIYFADANTGYAVGTTGTILKLNMPVSYSWSPENSLNTPNLSNPVANPTGTTTYIVTATFENGCTAKDSVTVFVTPLTADAGMNKTITCGGTAQLTNVSTNYTGTGTLTYHWSPTTGLNDTTLINPAATVSQNTKYYVTVSTPNGCTATDSVTVFVNPVKAEAGMNKAIFCGEAIQLDSVTSNYTGTGTLTYSWSPAAGLNNDTIANPVANPNTTSIYFVTITTPNGCTAIDSVTVNVFPFIADAGLDKTIVCGGIAQFDNVNSNYLGTGMLSYLWSPPTGLDYDTLPNPKAYIIQNMTYYVTVTTPNGCIAYDSVNIFVTPLSAEAGTDKSIICGGTGQFDNVFTDFTGQGPLTYSWSPAAGLSDTTLINPAATVIQNTKYYVTVTTPNGCTATDSINVLVNPLTISGTNINISCGDSMLLSTTTNYTGTGTLTYAWSPSAGLGDTTIANPYVTGISNQQYNVIVNTPNGCEASNNVFVSLTPMNLPEVCIVGVDSTNKNLVIWNKPLSAAIDSFYVYKETGTTNVYNRIGSVSYDSLSVFVDNASQPDVQSDKYKISILDKCGLETALSDYHKTMHLTINQGVGTAWNLIWEPYEGFTVSSYRIYRGHSPDTLQQIGTVLGGSTQYSDLTPPSGYSYYQVEVISPNSCNPAKSYNSSRSNIVSNNPNGIANTSIRSDFFSIYPNPANNEIEITVHQKSLISAIDIEIFNTTGQMLRSMNLKESHTTIDISGFASGIYFIKVIPIAIGTDAGIAVKKFVKE